MQLFTVIIEYRGGIYINQINACSIDEVSKNWIAQLDYKTIKGLGKKSYLELYNFINEENDRKPLPIDGNQNVWCYCHTVNKSLMLINIVLTVKNK